MSRKSRKPKKSKHKNRQRPQIKVPSQSTVAESASGDAARKCKNFEPKTKKELAAQLLAEDHITETEIAETVGVDPATLWRWKQEPEFQASVAEIQKQILNLSRRYLIARKSYRLGNLQRRLLAMEEVIRERGVDPDVQKAAGGKTGLLVRRVRMIGHGESAQVVEEFAFDAALIKEMREHEKQGAQEAGDWVEKVAPTDPSGEHEFSGVPAPDLDAYRKLPVAERIRLLRSSLRVPPVDRGEPPAEVGSS